MSPWRNDKRLNGGATKDVRKIIGFNNVFLMKKLFNLKMAKSGSVAEYLNKFNTLMS